MYKRQRNQIVLLKAGVVGEPNGRPDSSPAVQRILMDLMARSASPEAVNGRPWTFQVRFSDADPWHFVVDNGSTRLEPGEAPQADVTLETDWQQWVAITTQGEKPLGAVLRRRLRPRGSLRGMRAFASVFGPSDVS